MRAWSPGAETHLSRPFRQRTPRRRNAGRAIFRAAVLFSACTATPLALSGTALAHIVDSQASAPGGSSAELTFRVPNEEAHATTIKIQVKLPADPSIARIQVRPVPGWSSQTTTIQATFDHVSRYVWHCHFLDHEDDGMMRPWQCVPY